VLVRRGALSTLIGALAGLRIISKARAKRWRAAIADIDKHLRQLGGSTKSSGLRHGLAGVLGSRVLSWTGTIVVLHALDVPMHAVLIIAMMSVGILVSWASSIVPLGIGIADGTNYVLYDLLGATSAEGLAFTMVGRLRTILVAVIGLGVMAIAHAFQRSTVSSPA
jgi:lysylphosphatidylglycerol synthase-like protein